MIQKGQALFATWGHLIDALAIAYLKWKDPLAAGSNIYFEGTRYR